MSKIEIVTPQFERPAGEPPPAKVPNGKAGFDVLSRLPKEDLLKLGMRQWGRQEDGKGKKFGPMLWLFPGEWYDDIPDGYPIVSISFKKVKFQKGKTDNDIRFGCLAFGILMA